MDTNSGKKSLLEIKDLNVEYRTMDGIVYAVNGLNLKLKKGTALGLVGETGAGKTTTALCIMGLLPKPPGIITQGNLFYGNRDLLNMNEKYYQTIRGNEITMIFQNPMSSLNPVISIGRQVSEVINHHQKIGTHQSLKKAVEMLKMVGISEKRFFNYPHEFSGGMKQRVMIAMSLACNPKLLIADEPTTALDVTIQAQIIDLLKKLIIKTRSSLLLITHDFGLVAELCDEVAVMYAGEIVEVGSIEEIFNNFSHPYIKGLFESVPLLEKDSERLFSIPGLSPDPKNLPNGCNFNPRCFRAISKCFEEKPALTALNNDHKIACWNRIKGGDKNDNGS